ncbi:hypothetical protein L1987_29582 [Smallanthus sonchifolius]|uniref:Uncharacterized protein n=1 Tax=Smallanthus sonchifolius TaxID=185202 RepID=A0ACB9I331_9ASTR|nr:hypothetical protein L1987_29582 [Smallanthus sonchifolius]
MATRVSNFSDMIHRVTASCLLHPLGSGNNFPDDDSEYHDGEDDRDEREDTYNTGDGNEDEEYSEPAAEVVAEEQGSCRTTREMEMVTLMGEVFETVSCMKKAYVSLQEAHCPWDADKMRLSDVAVVTELRKLGFLRERFRQNIGRVGGGVEDAGRNRTVSAPTLREVVAPYEAAMEKLKTELKSKEVEVDNLREKLKTATTANGGGSNGRKSRSHPPHQSKRRVSCSSQFQGPSASAGIIPPAAMAVPELFEACMNSVKEGSRSFASLLLSLMKAAHWDITATVKSIIATATSTNAAVTDSIVGPNSAKYSLESYVNRKFFQGFDHETFYMDGSLSSLLNPNQFRSECFTQYSDMKSMDPMELLGILPTCQLGKFCSKKYLSIVHPKMEESLFGDLEQRRQVLAGNHPRSRFYGEFLGLAKAVWLLHLAAFSLDPLPSHFEGSRGAEFHPEYMESAVRPTGGRLSGGGLVVGFPVSPGFKLGNGYVVKARVYLVSKREM